MRDLAVAAECLAPALLPGAAWCRLCCSGAALASIALNSGPWALPAKSAGVRTLACVRIALGALALAWAPAPGLMHLAQLASATAAGLSPGWVLASGLAPAAATLVCAARGRCLPVARSAASFAAVVFGRILLAALDNAPPRYLLSIVAMPVVDSSPSLVINHERVTVVFVDVVGSTALAASMTPQQVHSSLDAVARLLDRVALDSGMQKIESVGDCHVTCSGISDEAPGSGDSGEAVAVRYMLSAREEVASSIPGVQLHMGANTGPLASGLVGVSRRRMSIFGDTVNTAARAQGCSGPGEIVICDGTFWGLPRQMRWIGWSQIVLDLKGKGPSRLHVLRAAGPRPDGRRARSLDASKPGGW